MDVNSSPLYDHVADLLPKPALISKDNLSKFERVYVRSLRFLSKRSTFLARGLLMDSKRCVTFVVRDLVFYLLVPARYPVRCLRAKRQFTVRLHNADRKIDEDFTVLVFSSLTDHCEASRHTNRSLPPTETTYCFGDIVNHRECTMDGNTVMVCNNFLCSRVYLYPRAVCPPEGHGEGDTLFPSSVSLGELLFDREVNDATLMNLNSVLPYVYREGAFDIETVYDDANYNKALSCEAFETAYFSEYRDLFARYERLTTRTSILEKPPTDTVVMKLHQVMSVSLVVCRYAEPKPNKSVHRKRLLVFYDASLSSTPPNFETYGAREDARSLGIDFARVEAVGCANEYEMLRAFLQTLVKNVDTLYVYHANFDVSILQQRLAYYGFARRSKGCCATHDSLSLERGSELRQLWRHFLSKLPDAYEGRLVLGLQQLHQAYRSYLNKVESILQDRSLQRFGASASDMWTSCKGAARMPLSLAKTEYNDAKAKLQNLKSNCFGSEVIDLMLVCRQPRFDQCNSGKLDQKAHLIISTLGSPGKNPQKARKLADVSYDRLDAAYRGGGAGLAECLIYNLIDSQLLIRIARCVQPLREYVFRQVSTYNTDQLVHNRGVMHFAGFVATVKSVEISKFKSRLDEGRVHSTGHLRNHLYTAETIPRRGGFVLQPLTGLSFSFPTRSFELIVDFASMYPGIMCDLNISSESIVDHGKADAVHDYLVYDWNMIPQGFSKYTLLARVDRGENDASCRLRKYKSDVYGSLRRYLELRAHHRACLKKAKTVEERDYHNRLQNEMKICANSHYGTADVACSLLITTQGQHRIKVVNESLKRVHSIPNYGDTDSTMFWSEADTSERSYDTSESREDLSSLLEELLSYVAQRFRATQTFVSGFLRLVAADLIDDTFSKTVLVTRGADGGTLRTPSFKCDKTGEWMVRDPVSNTTLNVSAALTGETITKLEYESCSSVTCHVAKKMYICLLHDLAEGDGTLLKTSLKRRGMTGFKTSRFGPTETIMNDFVCGIFRGDALCRRDTCDRYEWTAWSRVSAGDRVMLPPPSATTDWEPTPTLLSATRRASRGDFCLIETTVSESGTRRWFLTHDDFNVTHLVSTQDHVLREKSFLEVCLYRTYAISRGLIPWHQLIRFSKPAAMKAEFLEKRAKYGLLLGKELKLPYVTVVDKKTHLRTIYQSDRVKSLQYPREWCKQDPAYAFFRGYPIDLKLDVLLRDYFGPSFLCESPTFERRDSFPASTLQRRYYTRPLVDQLEIKSRIDSTFLNSSSKCLVHVLMDLHGPSEAGIPAREPERIEECVTRVVNAVLTTKRRIEDLMRAGKTVFYSLKCNVPPEMKSTACGSESYVYSTCQDETARPLSSPHVRDCEPSAESMYAESVRELRTRLASCLEKTLIRLAPLSEPLSNKTLTVLSPRVSRDCNVFSTPQVILVSNATEDEDLCEAARWLHTALLARHCLDGDEFEFHPPPPITRLGAPPTKALASDLRAYFAALDRYLRETSPGEVRAHCSECYGFWRRQRSCDVISKNYYFNGKHYCFYRDRLPCPLLV